MFLCQMNSAIGILTYRRVESLKLFLGQVTEHCKGVPIAVFEDCGQIDETEEFLARGATFLRRDHAYEADVYTKEINGCSVTIFLSHENAGVSGNSNKAIKWFMEETACNHLCLCNDDLEASGPFHETYATAHEKLNVGLFCFCDFEGPGFESYRWATVKARGMHVKLLTRMTGIMMSMTRELVDRIGYFDAFNFTFGQEHCDYTNRARLTGFMDLNGTMQHCLDVVCPELKHQEVESSLTDSEKQKYNSDADVMIEVIGSRRPTSDPYVPFSTGRVSRVAGARDGVGIPAYLLSGYSRVKDRRLDGASPIIFNDKPEVVNLGTDKGPATFDNGNVTF
jgi:hypothetical protein